MRCNRRRAGNNFPSGIVVSDRDLDQKGRLMNTGSSTLMRESEPATARVNVEFGAVLGLLLFTGWVANHFVALMPAISDRQHLSTATLDAIFGIYAVGLLPGLLLGGRASDALGRRAVVLTGSATAAAGTVL